VVNKETMQDLQCQEGMDLAGVISLSSEMSLHDSFHRPSLDVRPGKGPLIQEQVPNVTGETLSIPDSIMVKLMPPEKQSLQMNGGQSMVYAGQPLGHSIIVGVFRLYENLL
jgi:hypothetical protein